MKPATLQLSEITFADSIYRFRRPCKWDDKYPQHKLVGRSFNEIGIVSPVIVHEADDGSHHLVDGFCRVAWAGAQKIGEITVTILPASIPISAVMMIVLAETAEKQCKNFAGKARFVAMAKNNGVTDDGLNSLILPSLDLAGGKRILATIEQTMAMPTEIIDFCDEKSFSMKQVKSLAQRDPKLLAMVFGWREKLHLTARVIEELCEQISDIIKARNISLEEFMENDEIKSAIGAADKTAQERTRNIRLVINVMRYPTLTKVNAEIKAVADDAGLPDDSILSWDKTLEIQEVTLKITARNLDAFKKSAEAISSKKVIDSVEKILEKL